MKLGCNRLLINARDTITLGVELGCTTSKLTTEAGSLRIEAFREFQHSRIRSAMFLWQETHKMISTKTRRYSECGERGEG